MGETTLLTGTQFHGLKRNGKYEKKTFKNEFNTRNPKSFLSAVFFACVNKATQADAFFALSLNEP